jgi:chaperonin GroES
MESEMQQRDIDVSKLRGNIAFDLDDDELARIGSDAVEKFMEDYNSITEWRKSVEEIRKLAAQSTEKKNYPFENASNVKYPLVTTSALQFNARSYPVIINDSNIALCKVIGNDEGQPLIQNGQVVMENDQPVWQVPPGAKQQKADNVVAHMNYQLTEQMDEWDSDMDQLLLALPIDGIAFKKTYWDSVNNKPVSEFINALDLVVNNYTKSLKDCPTISHIFSLYPHEIKEKINGEDWIPIEHMNDTENPVDFVEQYGRYDRDGDGYTEPYIITYRKDDGKVVSVIPNFDEETTLKDKKGIIKIDPLEYFTSYHFLPDPEGHFYSRGFGHLLKPINDSVDSILNQLIDAGHLANAGGGFIAKSFRIKSGTFKIEPQKWHKVDTMGLPMKDAIMPYPIKEPSAVLFSLLGFLIDAGKEIASIQDVMTGGGGQNTTATTTLAMIEQGMMVYNSIFRRVHRGMRQELIKLFNLNRKYLTDEQYVKILDRNVSKDDYDMSSMDIAPAADPSMATDMQKTAKSQVLMQYAELPFMNAQKIAMSSLRAAGISDPEQYLAPQQGPSFEQMMEQAQMELEFRKQDMEEWNSKFSNAKELATALEKVANSDEKGADSTLNAAEIFMVMEHLRNANERKGLQQLEGGTDLPMGLPQ